MISTHEAFIAVSKVATPLEGVLVDLEKALGAILTQDIIAPLDLPEFNQSAMDGYAFKGVGLSSYEIIGVIQAGDDATTFRLKEGESVKIFTGAMCPESADAVCRIEDIVEGEGRIVLVKEPPIGANIRIKGEQIEAGSIALHKGHKIAPASVGFLASLGLTQVEVARSPSVAIVSTGNELIPLRQQLQPGKIFESNGIMLKSALFEAGLNHVSTDVCKDDVENTVRQLQLNLEKSDVLIVSGGVSVGDYDYVAESLQKIGVEKIFHKVSQKPGMPLYFGKKGGKLIFGLPGNPAAALTCFYIYVLPAIKALQGGAFEGLEKKTLKCKNGIPRPISRDQFLKAKYSEGEVEILDGQSSAMLATFAESNALVFVPVNTVINSGDSVTVYLIY